MSNQEFLDELEGDDKITCITAHYKVKHLMGTKRFTVGREGANFHGLANQFVAYIHREALYEKQERREYLRLKAKYEGELQDDK